MAGSGTILRKDLITDEALTWGEDYAKNLNKAIEKNGEFVESIKAYYDILKTMQGVKTNTEFLEVKKEENNLLKKAGKVWKEQIQLENQLLSIKRKQELATESTNRALIKERTALQETNKKLREQAKEQLGLVSAYDRLNKRRAEAQKRLADLLAAENQNIKAIARAKKEFDLLDARVKQIDATTKNYTKTIGNYQSAFDGLGSTVKDVFSAFGLVTGIAFGVKTLNDIFTTIKDVDRQLIAVRKTTNMTEAEMVAFRKEVVDLGDALDGISIQGLLKTAEIAGQLGIQGSENILKFSKTVEQLKLTSDLVSDESVSAFAQFIQISSDSIENADKLGSVITELGNNFNATESKVLSNSSEIQKGIAVYNTAAQNVLALGAATASLGSEAEVSRTAIQKTLGVFNEAVSTGKGLQQVLELTGYTEAELSAQFDKDSTVVFQRFIKGLNDVRKSGGNLKNTLDALGLSEVRTFSVIGNLASNYETLEDAMNRANAEYENNTALSNEAKSSAESIASLVSDLRDRWEAYILRLNDVNDGTSKITSILRYLRDNLDTIIDRVIKFGTIFLTFIGIMKTVNFITSTYSALTAASTAAQLRFAAATGIGTKNILAQAAALRTATAAQQGLNTAMNKSPWGIVVGLIGAAVSAYKMFNEELSYTEELQNAVNNSLDAARSSEEKQNSARDLAREEAFKAIEKEMELRKAQGEQAESLDNAELARKRAYVQKQLNDLRREAKKVNDELQEALNQNNTRIVQLVMQSETYNEEEIRNLKIKNAAISASLKERNNIYSEEEKKLNQLLSDLEHKRNINTTKGNRELTEKEKRERERQRREYLLGLKKLADDEFALYQFRLKNLIDLNQQTIDSDTATSVERIDALSENEQLQQDILRKSAEKKLKDISWYDDKVRDLTQEEINTLLNGGEIKKKLNDAEILVLEQFNAERLKLQNEYATEQQELIDDEVKRHEKKVNDILSSQNIELNNAIASATKIYQANLETAKKDSDRVRFTEQYENEIFAIKIDFAKRALNEQIKAIETLLAQNELSADLQKKKEEELSQFKAELAELDLENYKYYLNKKVQLEKETNEKIKELSQELGYALVDLTNAIFDARIANIEYEMRKWDEYYDKEIEKAGNNERQKKYLQEERDKKEKELEARKRKEQQKQAIFNKAISAAEVSMKTAQAIMSALAMFPPNIPLSILAGSIGAVQLAKVIATPIPQYEFGVDNHPGGPAEVAEKRPEVIMEPGKKPYIVSEHSILNLAKGTKVVPSVDEFNRMEKAAFMASLDLELGKYKRYEANKAFSDRYTVEMLGELKEVNKNLKNNKPIVNVYQQYVDIPHELWKSKLLN